jgi:hypothetical protein
MKKNTLTAMMIALVVAMAPVADATAKNNKKQSAMANTTSTIDMKQIGNEEGYVYLQISVTQLDNQLSVLEITDAEGEKLYAEKVRNTKHTRLVKVDPFELDNLRINLKSPNGIATKTYDLNVSRLNVYSLTEVVNK